MKRETLNIASGGKIKLLRSSLLHCPSMAMIAMITTCFWGLSACPSTIMAITKQLKFRFFSSSWIFTTKSTKRYIIGSRLSSSSSHFYFLSAAGAAIGQRDRRTEGGKQRHSWTRFGEYTRRPFKHVVRLHHPAQCCCCFAWQLLPEYKGERKRKKTFSPVRPANNWRLVVVVFVVILSHTHRCHCRPTPSRRIQKK